MKVTQLIHCISSTNKEYIKVESKLFAQSLEMEFKRKVEKHVLSSQTREVISNVFKYMEEEKELGAVEIPLQQSYERVVAATGVSEKIIRRILKDKTEINAVTNLSSKSPKKKKGRQSSKTDLDEVDKGMLRRVILNLYTVDKIAPTMQNILRKFQETGYRGGKDSLLRVMKSMGFRWTKTKGSRKLLIEKHDIRLQRVTFLHALKSYRNEKRSIIYIDETHIHSMHSNNSNEGLAKPTAKGQRLIIVHAGGENGFIQNAELIFKSNAVTGDYHHEMSFTNYKKWLTEKLIPRLPPRSVLVTGSVLYHNVPKNRPPNSNSTKDTMTQWLRANNISFDPDMLKPDLYNIIKIHEPKLKTFEIDELLVQSGHGVLRLPPCHPDLNPMELVWSSLKQFVAQRNVSFKIKDVEQLCRSFINEFSADEWMKRCDHSRKWEDKFLEAEPCMDEEIDKLIINLVEDSESETEESSSEEEFE